MDKIDPTKITREMYGCEPEDIGETVVLTPGEKSVESLREKIECLKELKGFHKGFTGSYRGKVVSVIKNPVGSPVASDSVYFLRFTRCRNVIYWGSIGALKENINIGDIITPTAAVRGEGSSKYHVEEWYPAVASFELLRKAAPILEETFSKLGVQVHYGVIYTTDSFAAETREFLEKLQKRNIIGIEMETSAIFTLANLQGMNVMAIHIVSDNPMVGKPLVEPLSPDDASRYRKSTETLRDVILDIMNVA